MSVRLGKQEWVDAGLRTLAGQGIDAVRVERLAADLKVTKGSFYWHFADRQTLLVAIVEAWKERSTLEVIQRVELQGGDDPGARLWALMQIVFSSDGRLDQQVRAWAAIDSLVRRSRDHIDRLRLEYVRSHFEQLGFGPAEAEARARFCYQALIGQFALGRPVQSQGDKAQLRMLFEMLTRA